MPADALSHRGIDAWLQDPKGRHLALNAPAIVEENQITTIIEFEKSQTQDAPPINAWCEIFRPEKSGDPKIVRVANQIMAANDKETQSRSSQGRLELPLQRDNWLWMPRSSPQGLWHLCLRLRKTPKETERPDENNPRSLLYEFDIDLLDKPPKPPYIIFRFEFKRKYNVALGLLVSNAYLAQRSPLRTKNARRALSGSKSEPEIQSASSSSINNPQHNQVDAIEGSSNKRKRQRLSDSNPNPFEHDAVDVVAKKQKIKIEETNPPEKLVDERPSGRPDAEATLLDLSKPEKHVNERPSESPQADTSLLDLVRNALEEEENLDAELREQQIAAGKRRDMLEKQKAADAEEKDLDAKLREQLLATSKRLETKRKQRVANKEEQADVSRREKLLATEKRISEKKKLLK
ncbi:hypothetical protein FB451DRAFT_1514539 [Mycena latifolia]|nr:hypothetical protein FB451DRAFT_1514539 [Mycena latifolia]